MTQRLLSLAASLGLVAGLSSACYLTIWTLWMLSKPKSSTYGSSLPAWKVLALNLLGATRQLLIAASLVMLGWFAYAYVHPEPLPATPEVHMPGPNPGGEATGPPPVITPDTTRKLTRHLVN